MQNINGKHKRAAKVKRAAAAAGLVGASVLLAVAWAVVGGPRIIIS